MVDLTGMFRRGLERIGLASPSELASPEDLTAPPDEGGMFTRPPETMLGLGGPYLKGLSVNDDSILTREGAQDLRLFDRLLDDDVAMSCLQQRRLAITSRDWEVTPGDDKDPRSVKAADELRAMFKELGLDRVTGNLHYAIWYGYAVGEGLYSTREFEGRRIIWLDDIVVPDRRWFGFTFEGELRLISPLQTFGGEAVPPNKFVSIRTGGTHDFAFYGLGLAHWAYWPIWFKRAATKFWALYLEKLSNPTAIGGFGSADTTEDKNNLLAALVSIGRDSAVMVPEELVDKIKFMEAQRSGAGTSSYREFLTENNEALMRIVLGQPGTSKATPQGVGGKQAEVHEDVKAEIVKADADLISEGLNTFGRWLTRWNHGEDVKAPSVFRVLDDAEDLNAVAERDAKLDALGWRRSDESIEQVYGEGYERKPEPETPPALDGPPGRLPKGKQPPANDDEEERLRAAFAAWDESKHPREPSGRSAGGQFAFYHGTSAKDFSEFKASKSGSLGEGVYLSDDLTVSRKWASGEKSRILEVEVDGKLLSDKSTDAAVIDDFVSTLAQKYEGDWAADYGNEYVKEQISSMGLSTVAQSMPGGVPALRAAAEAHGYAGIRNSFETVVFDPKKARIIGQAARHLGKKSSPGEFIAFGAEEEAEIERLTSALMDEANPVFSEFAASIKTSLATARENAGGELSLEGTRVALLQAFERFEPAKLARLTGLAFVAERAAAEAGVEDKITV